MAPGCRRGCPTPRCLRCWQTLLHVRQMSCPRLLSRCKKEDRGNWFGGAHVATRHHGEIDPKAFPQVLCVWIDPP